MKKLAALVALAFLGVAFASWSVKQGNRLPPDVQPAVAPALSPYHTTVAGAGLIEPVGDIVRVAAPVGDIITEVLVEPGAKVIQGTPLIRLDTRAVIAQEGVQLAALKAAQASLQTSHAARDEAKDNASRAVGDLLSQEENARRAFALLTMEARVLQAEAAVQQVEAALHAVRIDLDRRTITAPKAGTVLRVDARPGEFATAGRLEPALITLGDLDHLQLRVDIDENDSWRVTPGAKAEGSVRGNPSLRSPLEFVRIEPYVVPKKSLTGQSAERVDTRVLQIIYRFTRNDLRVYAGQQMDVFIDTADQP